MARKRSPHDQRSTGRAPAGDATASLFEGHTGTPSTPGAVDADAEADFAVTHADIAGTPVTRLPVRVSPKASRDALRGLHGGALKVAVTAPPEKGKANQAVVRLLAAALGVKVGDVRVAAGATSRDKVVEVDGHLDEAALRRITST